MSVNSVTSVLIYNIRECDRASAKPDLAPRNGCVVSEECDPVKRGYGKWDVMEIAA